jgi:threonine synthase
MITNAFKLEGSMRFSYLSHLECPRDGLTFDAGVPQKVCECGSPLLARYDLGALAREVSRDEISAGMPSLWRYHCLLPVKAPEAIVTLGEGLTPIIGLPKYGAKIGVPRLVVKDEGLLPTGSFKGRGAAVGVSRAKELGITRIAMPTNGNAGAAWSTYAARSGMAALIVMPQDAPEITRKECLVTGAELYLVDGLIGDAGRIVERAVAQDDWFPVATLKEPYRLEGKKTMGFEIAEQLCWRVPDVIVYPTGGGVGLIGIYKALLELQELGWIGKKLPRMVAVQASGCAPIVRAFESGANHAEPWQDAATVAFGINVPSAIGDFLILDAVRSTQGCAVAVSDEAILAELADCARNEGIFFCPEGAATLAGVRQLRESGWLDGSEEVLVLNTGAGIKYPNSVTSDPPLLAVDGNVESTGHWGRSDR